MSRVCLAPRWASWLEGFRRFPRRRTCLENLSDCSFYRLVSFCHYIRLSCIFPPTYKLVNEATKGSHYDLATTFANFFTSVSDSAENTTLKWYSWVAQF